MHRPPPNGSPAPVSASASASATSSATLRSGALPCVPGSRGQVTLVGAGPGDPDLLTLQAVKAIAQATVILVDDLVNPAVLFHATSTARRIQVGKRGGCQSTPQAFIERLMVQEARQGERVVRLKGGDPFIFGRGGEEVEALQAQGIDVAVVNGITAGLAGATSLLTPLTHRDHAHGVMLVTGHAKPHEPGPDWAALGQAAAAARLTLVIYMGVTHIDRIAQGLMHGLPGHTPALVVQHASLPQQRQALTTLAQLADTMATQQLGSPSVVLVGAVCMAAAACLTPTAWADPTLQTPVQRCRV